MHGTTGLYSRQSPGVREQRGAMAASPTRATPANAERSFLVVDESPTIRLTATDALKKLGFPEGAVHVATSPDEGLTRFYSTQPNVVFIEIDADEGDGLSVALEMLEIDPRTKIIIFTSRGRDCERVRRAVRAGAFAVIEKPLRYEKLRSVLAELQMEEGGIERLR